MMREKYNGGWEKVTSLLKGLSNLKKQRRLRKEKRAECPYSKEKKKRSEGVSGKRKAQIQLRGRGALLQKRRGRGGRVDAISGQKGSSLLDERGVFNIKKRTESTRGRKKS